MKKFLSISLLLLSLTAIGQVEKHIPQQASPPKLVNVFAKDFMTAEQIAGLESKLVAYDDSTSNQITVVVVEDLKGFSAADYAIALGRKWGVGNKDFNNGVVLLVSTGGGEGNRDVFIAPGYGLEGAVTDIIANTIIENDIIPNFRAGNYYRGLDEATDAIIAAAEGRYTAPAGYGSRRKGKGISPFMIIIGVIVLIVFLAGSSGGGKGGGYVSRRGYRGWGAGPFVGGGWSGGGGGFGGGGGGGFGGFGGGSFGGGGAGGKW